MRPASLSRSVVAGARSGTATVTVAVEQWPLERGNATIRPTGASVPSARTPSARATNRMGPSDRTRANVRIGNDLRAVGERCCRPARGHQNRPPDRMVVSVDDGSVRRQMYPLPHSVHRVGVSAELRDPRDGRVPEARDHGVGIAAVSGLQEEHVGGARGVYPAWRGSEASLLESLRAQEVAGVSADRHDASGRSRRCRSQGERKYRRDSARVAATRAATVTTRAAARLASPIPIDSESRETASNVGESARPWPSA